MKKKYIGMSLIALPILTGAAIAFFLPLEAVNYSFINKTVAIARIVFPTVEKMKGGYSLGSVTLIYFSTIWLLTPLTVFGWHLYIAEQKEMILKKCKANRWGSLFFAGLFFPAIILIAFFANFESTDTTDARTYFTYQSRFGLATMGFWIPTGAGMFLAICIFWWSHIQQVFEN